MQSCVDDESLNRDELAVGDARFGSLVEDGTTLLIPSRYEVSADQRATHLAGLLAASVRGSPTWEYAVWSRIDSPVPATGRKLLLGESLSSLKRRAVCCFQAYGLRGRQSGRSVSS